MKHPFRIVIVFIVGSIMGLAVIPKLSIDLNPAYNLPRLTISYSMPGTSPEIIEQRATSPLENVLSQIGELKEITSVSNYNRGRINLVFNTGVDIDFKRFEVSSIIRNSFKKLPENLSYPIITHNDPEKETKPLLVYRVNGPASTSHIKTIAEEKLRVPLATLKGIEEIEITGATDLQITIQLKRNIAQSYKISSNQIAQELRTTFRLTYPGVMSRPTGQKIFVKTGNKEIKLHDIEKLIISNDPVIRIRDIAKVFIAEQTPRQYFRVNGLNSVSMVISGRSGQNKIKLAENIKAEISNIATTLPNGYEILMDYDDTEFLITELNKIYYRAGLSILILIVFIFLIHRNLKYLTILISGIIVNLCLTTLVAWALNINIHLYTIAGLTISFGLIVDNAIVMLDHIRKKRNQRIFLALLAATITTIAALSMVYFLPEQEKHNLIEFSSIIIVSLVLSLLVALFFTPSLYILLFRTEITSTKTGSGSKFRLIVFRVYENLIYFLAKYRKSFVIVLLFVFGTPVFLLPSKWDGQEWYNKTVGSEIYQENIRPFTDKYLGGTLRLFVRNVFEKSGYRTNEQTRLIVNARLSYGHTIEQMNEVMAQVEDFLKTVDGLDRFVTTVNSGRNASIFITFQPEYERGFLPYWLKSRLIARSIDKGGTDWRIYGVGRGFSNIRSDGLPSYRVVMKGYNYNELAMQAEILSDKLLKHKRIQKVNTNERLSWNEASVTQLVLHPDQSKMALSGISPMAVTKAVKEYTVPETPIYYIQTNNSNYPVYIVPEGAQEFSRYDLMNSNLDAGDYSFQLSNYASIVKESTINAIRKENRQYIRVVGFDYYGSGKFGNLYLDEVLEEMELEMPMGYEAARTSGSWGFDKVKRNYLLLLILIVAIYFICSILFENLKQPFYIIGVIPISFVGLFLTFAVFDFYFDQGGYAAFVLLGGLVVNAAIFIINDLNNFRGGEYNKNVLLAVRGKARPIMLTIISTCFGLVPFLIEGQNEVFWFSLAAGTIGGLIVSMFAVFICLPVWLMNPNLDN